MNLIPFQYSIKLESGEIYMVQASTAEELGLAIQEIKTKFLRTIPEQPLPATVTTPSGFPPPTASTPQSTLICNTCGGKAEIKEGTSKAGNHYKIFRCLSNPETAPNGHSKFIK